MNFRTEMKIDAAALQLNYEHAQIFMGSCFADNMGSKTADLRFHTLVNPFGVVFNPFSICKNVLRALEKRSYSISELGQHNGLYYSFDHHSSFSHINAQQCLQGINSGIEETHDFLKNSKVLFLTFGSAWVYLHNENAVANCHKIPQSNFTKELLSLENIVSWYNGLMQHLQRFNSKLQVVFTVSPVRHLKDGFIENQRSKAILIEAVHRLVGQNKNAFYFPAYELVMDDLRDYRFFGRDLLHLNEIAIDYVWEKFTQTYYSEHSRKIMNDVAGLNSFLKHRPLHDSQEQIDINRQNAIKNIKEKYPFLNV